MKEGPTDTDSRQAFNAFCLYALSYAGFLYFWAAMVFNQLPMGAILTLSTAIWLGCGVLAIRTHLWSIDRKAWQTVPVWQWAAARSDALRTSFVLWNICNLLVLGIDAALRKTGTVSAAYPWFMFLTIGMGYGAALWLCGSLATRNADTPEFED